jgi:PilZ domain-containing protein
MRHEGSAETPDAAQRLGVITRRCQMRVLDCSASGCLIETDRRFEVGAIASVRVVIDGRELTDDVQVVRCQLIAGAGSVYHLGVRFLWTNPPGASSLRAALWSPPSKPSARSDD